MTALEQVAQLKLQAIELLTEERERIDAELSLLQQESAPAKRRGRRPKSVIEPEVLATSVGRSDMTE